jgi:hypothetical protein
VPIAVSQFLAGMDGPFLLYPSCMVLNLFSMNRAHHRGVVGSACLWTFVLLISTSALAGDSNQDSLDPTKQTISQGSSSLFAVPNRPTFSTTAEAVQKGVFEVEFGLEAADAHQNFNGLLIASASLTTTGSGQLTQTRLAGVRRGFHFSE